MKGKELKSKRSTDASLDNTDLVDDNDNSSSKVDVAGGGVEQEQGVAASGLADQNNNTTNNNMGEERPSMAFNSFSDVNDRQATSGSHGFSAINMFGGVNDNADSMMMMDDVNGVGNFGSVNDTTATEFGQGFSQSFDPMAAAEAAFQDFGGFNTTTRSGNSTTRTDFGQGFSQSFDPMAAAEAAFHQDFGGFNTTADKSYQRSH